MEGDHGAAKQAPPSRRWRFGSVLAVERPSRRAVEMKPWEKVKIKNPEVDI